MNLTHKEKVFIGIWLAFSAIFTGTSAFILLNKKDDKNNKISPVSGLKFSYTADITTYSFIRYDNRKIILINSHKQFRYFHCRYYRLYSL